jgi:hypothetical protein
MRPYSSLHLAAGRAGLRIAFLSILLFAGACAKPSASVQPGDLIQIDALAALLADSTAIRPALVHVGFEALYRSNHIPGSKYVGAGSKPEGIAGLKQYLKSLPADQPVVLYCGCCPWTDCPNVQPAFRAAKETGHLKVHVLYITGNFERDWVAKGLPSAKGDE